MKWIEIGNSYANPRNIYSSDTAIEACTSLIMSSRIEHHELAVLYSDRCGIFIDDDFLDKALTDCNEAICLTLKLAIAFIQRAGIYAATNEFDQALTDYGRALWLAPNSVDAYEGRGEVKNALHRYGRAAADFAQATWLDPIKARVGADFAGVESCWMTSSRDSPIAESRCDSSQTT